MNQPASDAPQHDGEPSPRADEGPDADSDLFSDLSARQLGAAAGNAAADPGSGESGDTEEDASVVAMETADVTGEAVRVGSPFAVDPFAPQSSKRVEAFHDVGPLRYTAMGAVAASIMVLAFAGAASWWFPAGGALIAALGCVLSIFGLYSSFRIASSGLLAIHLSLFVLSYVRSLG